MGRIFRDDRAITRPVIAVPVEFHDEWAVVEVRNLSEESMAVLGNVEPVVMELEEARAVATTG